MLFAAAAELATFAGIAVDEDRATLLVELASAAIEDAAGCPLDQTTETVTIRSRGQGTLLLPAFPVTAVASVTVGGEELADVEWTRAGELTRTSGWAVGDVVVDYTHGYATAPDGLKAVCLEVAARALVNPQSLASFNSDGTVVQFAPRLIGLTADERDRVMRAIR